LSFCEVSSDIAPNVGEKCCASMTRIVGDYVGTLNGVDPLV
jgi:hypothetical protein